MSPVSRQRAPFLSGDRAPNCNELETGGATDTGAISRTGARFGTHRGPDQENSAKPNLPASEITAATPAVSAEIDSALRHPNCLASTAIVATHGT